MSVVRVPIPAGLLLLATGGVIAQQRSPPALAMDDAVAIALDANRLVRSSVLDVKKAAEGTAATRTQRLPQFRLFLLGGGALRPIEFTIPRGILGSYPATGPIPAQNSKISNPQTFSAVVLGQAVQPLSQLWKVHLGVLESRVGEESAGEQLRKVRMETARAVRELYYQIVQTQAQVESAEATVKYLVDLQHETDLLLAEETVLKSDSLAVRAKLSQQRYRLLTMNDSLDSQKESMNRLLGRDLSAAFSVVAEPVSPVTEIDVAAAREEALSARPEIRQARLQTKRAEIEARRERAEYIPDLSATFTYFSVPNVSFAPQNVVQAGISLQWQPFDWGRKQHTSQSLKYSVEQGSLNEREAEQQVILDVNTKFRKLAEARALLDASSLAQEVEREKMRVVTNQYGQKAALLSDVLQQEAAGALADTDYRKALAAFWTAKADFDSALGRY